ncbi:hypothetical protein V499_06787 [Pseudogymnoascus sp. VKM F-103]|uniref:Alpha/beta hydrolase fold-3 domain-containing protein n=1 Tax=Pseudogymnoascus verrucosus TaxID=342668 RepID=A0A1B8GIF8_9PEZI|nr:uncharacterized protein VE01_05865 [Pseudogymnoascus verrucosus]KFY73143.1 hypothetical protein V499_06787 [Pseudogymnoascus sp. VKM F-103]OBT95598.1 hypothetical protein VE01_05865 [Pseudogymnoascus verrucosus]
MTVRVDVGEHAYSATLWEWIVLLSKATAITFRLMLKAAKAGRRDQKNGLTFHQYIAYQGMRDYQCGLDAVAIQNLLPSTSKTCEGFASRHRIANSTIRLPCGTTAQWLGPRNALKVVVLFHGGGYMSPALSEHVSLAFGMSDPSRRDAAVVVLSYNLACESANRYPRQLQQAVALLGHLLHVEKVLPSSITLLGDSAGAHLLLSLVLHLSHPNPLVTPLKFSGRLSGAVLVSPWVTMDTSAASMQLNKDKDVLSASSLEYWAQNFLGGADYDSWNTPTMAPEEWWGDLLVDDILVLYGHDELLRDDTLIFCERLRAGHAKTTVLDFPGEAHVHMLMNRFLRINKPCKSEETLVNWMDSHLGDGDCV